MNQQHTYLYLCQQGMDPQQAAYHSAVLAGRTAEPGCSSSVERPTDTEYDTLAGSIVELTPDKPEATIAMPKGFRASGNEVLNITFSVFDAEYRTGGEPQTVFRNSISGSVAFGAGGAPHKVILDIKRGAQISVIGQNPRVGATLEDPDNPDSPRRVRVSASIGSGTRASRAFNTRTLPPRLVPPGSTLFSTVPDFGFSFLPFADDPAALGPGATLIQFWSYAGQIDYRVGSLYGTPPPIALAGQLVATLNGSDFVGARLSEGMILPQGADLITITNNLGTGVTWSPCFGLSI